MVRKISAAILNHVTVYALGLLLLAFFVLTLVQDRSARKHLDAIETVSALVTELETNIGYGGLIHHLKNSVLRPSEPAYLEAARTSAIQSLDLIEQLDASITFEADLSETQAMVLAYQSRIDMVENMIAEGNSPGQIDAVIRYDDTLALAEISGFREGLFQHFRENTQRLNRLTSWIMVLMAVAMLLPLVAVYQTRLSRKRAQIVELTKKMNKALETQNNNLRHSNSALRQFAGIVSHDLKAPARQVHMFADIALSAKNTPDVLETSLNSIRELSDEMDALIARLLEFTRATFQEPKCEAVNLENIVKTCTQRAADHSGRSPIFHITPMPDAYVDPILMERVLCNLIQNAVKYVQPDQTPEVKISATQDSDGLLIEITDNGPSIDPKYAEVIFDPLHRIHKASDESAPDGNGLGLAIVRSIVESHAGTVGLDNSYEGPGSRFSIRLPHAVVDSVELMIA